MSARTTGWLAGVFTAALSGVALAAADRATGPWRVAGVAINTVVFGGTLGALVGMTAARLAASGTATDGAERLLNLATAGLPKDRLEWGAAMRAELTAIDDTRERRRFARGAAGVAVLSGFGRGVPLGLATGLVVAIVTVVASRAQLTGGGPGILSVTVPAPAMALLAVSSTAAWRAGLSRAGLHAGATAFAASFLAVTTMAATEGMVWMDRLGVFVLDADPPRTPATVVDVAFDLFTTGMWVAHVLFWLPWPFVGAWIGSRGAARKAGRDTRSVRTAG